MPHKYSCFLCKKEVTRSNKPKHLFSAAHAQDIFNEILKKKAAFSAWLKSIEEGRPAVIPSIFSSMTALARGYKICYACKTLQETPLAFSACSCGDVAKNASVIKDILETKTFVANPLYQKSVAVEAKTADTQTEEGGGGGDTQKLQKEIARLKKQREIDEVVLDEADEMTDGLFTVLEMLQEYNLDVMLEAMRLLKDDYPLAYERQKKMFGATWDDSLMSQGAVEE